MIQRIQTLYMLLCCAALAVTAFTPIAMFTANGEEMVLKAFSLSSTSGSVTMSALWMGILIWASLILPLLMIFFYHHRTFQLRMMVVECVLLLGVMAYEAVYCFITVKYIQGMEHCAFKVQTGAIMPIVALILSILAARAIFRDIVLLRSLDRIR
ncbi:MAG: DUF4293 domain-containing protein [Alistipes sp.]|nr:DUF4293 domain-containing protein [Candidatus Alistipes equi]